MDVVRHDVALRRTFCKQILYEVIGDKAGNGYYLFSITVELDKRIEPRKCKDGWRGGERVYIKETTTSHY